jgi:DNA-directed RNA polymerase subunit omega
VTRLRLPIGRSIGLSFGTCRVVLTDTFCDPTNMIDALKSDYIVNKLGGRFKLTALIQRRLGELIEGARPLVDRNGRSDFEVVIEEILQEKITIDFEASGIPLPGSEYADRKG